jgi:hypothetical protein
MKIILSTAVSIALATVSAIGWIIDKPIDYPKQLQSADFVGVVEVTKIVDTGKKKVISEGGVAFRELRLELKVLSSFKGKGETIMCSIYREPTEEELIADGVAKNDAWMIHINLVCAEVQHLFPARAMAGERLLVYLAEETNGFTPVSGDCDSSHSLIRLEPSNLVNTLDLARRRAEQPGPAQPATQPADKPPVKDQPPTPTSKDAPR